MNNKVRIFEMGPRDGLQNEKKLIETADKITLVDMLSDCGFEKIEVTSFVSPKWVPQMADASEVMAGITREAGVSYAVLTPNMRGYDGALAAKADEIAVFGSASEGFSQSNINCSVAESIERFKPVIATALQDNIPVRGYISCVTNCPFDGPTPPETVARIAETLFKLGCYEVSLGDTIGHGTPETISVMLDAVLQGVPAEKLAGHYHDTLGNALANISASLEKGLRTYDAAIGGLGGCPYAPGAKGNVDTGAVVSMLDSLGFNTDIDSGKLRAAADFAVSLR